jgi:hypothetical protein
MLIAIMVMFILLVSPDFLLDFFTYIVPAIDISNYESVIIVRSIVNILHISNYSFNFILYWVMNSYFRRTMKELLCRCFMTNSSSENNISIANNGQILFHPAQQMDSLLASGHNDTSKMEHRKSSSCPSLAITQTG